jgi:flavin reductase (DIM6/NTAB) family NADH-FMN oxidoreductase RutF
MSRSRDTVHELVSELDYPMFIVTVAAAGERAGCLVGFATQCSIDPPRFLVCLSDKNRTYRVAQAADAMVVHLVPRAAEELARTAATGSRAGSSPGWTPATTWRSCSSPLRRRASRARGPSSFTAPGAWSRDTRRRPR